MQRSLYVHINNIKLSEFDEIFQHIQFTRKKMTRIPRFGKQT